MANGCANHVQNSPLTTAPRYPRAGLSHRTFAPLSLAYTSPSRKPPSRTSVPRLGLGFRVIGYCLGLRLRVRVRFFGTDSTDSYCSYRSSEETGYICFCLCFFNFFFGSVRLAGSCMLFERTCALNSVSYRFVSHHGFRAMHGSR